MYVGDLAARLEVDDHLEETLPERTQYDSLNRAQKQQRDERQRRRNQGGSPETKRYGDADRRGHPDARCCGETPDVDPLSQNGSRAEKADTGHYLSRNASRIEPHDIRIDEGRRPIGPGHREEGCAQSDENVRAKSGRLLVVLALEPDEPAESGGRKQAQAQLPPFERRCHFSPITTRLRRPAYVRWVHAVPLSGLQTHLPARERVGATPQGRASRLPPGQAVRGIAVPSRE